MEKEEKRTKDGGITLIALVITIIVLLILAGITISLTFGNNGLLNRAEKSGTEYNKQEATEKINLKITSAQVHTYTEKQRLPTLQELANEFSEDDEISYVHLEAGKVASLAQIDIGDAESIFTKLEGYPYEFEINASLQLASINGEKVATANPVTTANSPTGVKTTTYIKETRDVTSAFSKVTSMNGFTREADDGNNIYSYLSWSDENGYTVLKDGWYYITVQYSISRPEVSVDGWMYFVLNGVDISATCAWCPGGQWDSDFNSNTLYLKKRR